MIAVVQLVALAYGTVTCGRDGRSTTPSRPIAWRPCRHRTSSRRRVALARKENPAFAPHWYSRPRWVWAPLPDDPDKATDDRQSATIFGEGQDVIDMPRYFKPWDAGLPRCEKQLKPLGDIKYFSKPEKQTLKERMTRRGLNPDGAQCARHVGWHVATAASRCSTRSRCKIRALIKPD